MVVADRFFGVGAAGGQLSVAVRRPLGFVPAGRGDAAAPVAGAGGPAVGRRRQELPLLRRRRGHHPAQRPRAALDQRPRSVFIKKTSSAELLVEPNDDVMMAR